MLLVAVDLDGSAERVIDEAVALATALRQRAILVTCVHPPTGMSDNAHLEGELHGETAHSALEREALDTLDAFAQKFPHGARTHIAGGDPAQFILDKANEVEARMIVMGTHGRKGLARLFQGSVADTVVRQSRVPVVVVPSAEHHLSPVQEVLRTELDG